MTMFCNFVFALLVFEWSSPAHSLEETGRQTRAALTETDTAFSIPDLNNRDDMSQSTDILNNSFPFHVPYSLDTQETQETISTASVSYDSSSSSDEDKPTSPLSQKRSVHLKESTSFQSKEKSEVLEPIGAPESSHSDGDLLSPVRFHQGDKGKLKIQDSSSIPSSEQERSEEAITDAEADWFWKMNVEDEVKKISSSILMIERAQVAVLTDTDELMQRGPLQENRLSLISQEIGGLHAKVDSLPKLQEMELCMALQKSDELLKWNTFHEDRLNLAIQKIESLHSKVDSLPKLQEMELCPAPNSYVGYILSFSAGLGLGLLGVYFLGLLK